MCGIAGFFGNREVSENLIFNTLEKMKNRGPDSQNFKTCNLSNNYFLTLLHSRLNIIDLDKRSNQPFEVDELIITFNGEIYNYVELRRELQNKNINLKTKSDTEVLLYYYKLYGEKCVDYFEGMWAFAIYDKKKNHLFLSRDRFGEKPLYFYVGSNFFLFGSEIKFIQELLGTKLNVNINLLRNFLINGYRTIYKFDECFFQRIHRLESGHSMIIKEGKVYKKYKYWSRKVKLNNKIKINDAVKEIRRILIESLRLRIRSDVPVAFCLSGGIDSSALVSIASKVLNFKFKTYSIIDEDERYNEEKNIMKTIKDTKCDYELITLRKSNFIDKLKKLVEYHDSPVSTISYFIHSMISERASKDGYKVIMSGTGADEIFTGYYDHFLYFLKEIYKKKTFNKNLIQWEKHIKKLLRNKSLKDLDSFLKEDSYRDYLYDSWEKNLSFLKIKKKSDFCEKVLFKDSLKNRMYNEMFYEIVPVILHEDDLNSMMNSIENRSPFLDRKLYEYALSIPTEFLMSNAFNKYILRESMKGLVSEGIRCDRQKKGFNASLNSMLDLKKPEIKDFFLDSKSAISEIVNLKKLSKMFDKDVLDNSSNKFLFSFMNCKIFLDKFN